MSPKKLFSDLNKDMDVNEESTNPELGYLAVIRQIRDNDPTLFSQVKQLPKKAKVGKMSDGVDMNATIGFIRKGALKTFFKSDDETKQLTFIEAIRLIQSEPDDPKVTIGSDFYDQYDRNSDAFDEMLIEEETVSTEKVMVTGNDAKIIRLLKAMKNEPQFTDDQEEKLDILIRRWENGEIPARISKDVVKKSKVVGDVLELYYDIMKLVPTSYLEDLNQQQSMVDGEKQVILSCYLKTGDNK